MQRANATSSRFQRCRRSESNRHEVTLTGFPVSTARPPIPPRTIYNDTGYRPVTDGSLQPRAIGDNHKMRYRADITAGSLKVPESRIIADLLLQGLDETGWKEALYDQNVLQTRSLKTAKRLVLLLRGRLELIELFPNCK